MRRTCGRERAGQSDAMNVEKCETFLLRVVFNYLLCVRLNKDFSSRAPVSVVSDAARGNSWFHNRAAQKEKGSTESSNFYYFKSMYR